MKKISTLLGLLSIAFVAQSQTCTSSVVIASTVDSLYEGTALSVVTHTSLGYTATGLPIVRRTLDPNTKAVLSIESYYYTGTRLDSIIGFTDETETVKNGKFRKYEYDANGNFTKETKNLGVNEEVTTFTYASNKLTSVTSADFTVTGITFNSTTNNLNTAQGTAPIVGAVTGTFKSDDKINPYSGKLGLNDDILSYFNTNNITEFKAEQYNISLFTLAYVYNSDNRPTSIVRNETIQNSSVRSHITYGCLNDLISSVNDAKITQTSNVAPNPSKNGIFQIGELAESIVVRDVTGAFVMESLDTKLDLSAHKAGMYFLEIRTQAGVKVAKIVKE